MSDIVERLLDYSKDDHERGCNGRYYDCSCGYDDKRDPLMVEAAKTIASLRDYLAKANMENDRLTRTNQAKREHRDKLLAMGVKAADEITRLRARVAELEEALRGLVDDEPCWLDHHGYCQAHSLGSPCEMANARAALREGDGR